MAIHGKPGRSKRSIAGTKRKRRPASAHKSVHRPKRGRT